MTTRNENDIFISREMHISLQAAASDIRNVARRLNTTSQEVRDLGAHLEQEGTLPFDEFLELTPREQRQIFADFKSIEF